MSVNNPFTSALIMVFFFAWFGEECLLKKCFRVWVCHLVPTWRMPDQIMEGNMVELIYHMFVFGSVSGSYKQNEQKLFVQQGAQFWICTIEYLMNYHDVDFSIVYLPKEKKSNSRKLNSLKWEFIKLLNGSVCTQVMVFKLIFSLILYFMDKTSNLTVKFNMDYYGNVTALLHMDNAIKYCWTWYWFYNESLILTPYSFLFLWDYV